MTLSLRWAVRSDVGLVRDGNEDSAYAGTRLVAVADGMGGHAAGEVASRVAIATIAPLDEDVPAGDLVGALHRAVGQANDQLRDMVNADSALDGMGTTLTALLCSGQRAALLHIGDSRAYLLRDGELTQITHDHTYVQQLVDEGRLRPEETNTHPQRSLITRALDGRRDVEPDVSVREVAVGDRYLLCTDGLSGVVTDETIREALSVPDPTAAVDRLIELALRGGGPDNVTVVVADIVDKDVDVQPVVAGALAADQPDDGLVPDTAAGRAALLTAARPKAGDGTAAATAPADPADLDKRAGTGTRARRRRWARPLVALAALAAVLVAAAAGGLTYVRSQWYVGVVPVASVDRVGIFQGVNAGIGSYHFYKRRGGLGPPVALLPPFERQQVQQGIDADNLSDARRIVGSLWQEACPPLPSPSPSPSASPHLSPTPRVSATRIPTVRRTTSPRPSARPSPRPSHSPSPAPTEPAVCRSAP